MIDIYDDILPQSYLSESIVTLTPSAYCEFASNQSSNPPVSGNLAKCYDEWVKIGAPGFILSVIRDGYKISPPKVTPNNSSALKEREFVSEAIFDLLKNKCV